MTRKILIGYCRVSTDEQAEHGYGLAVQAERIKNYVAALGLELKDVIIDDGYSGTTIQRPGLQKALQMVSEGEVDGVIVAKIDRFSRSLRNLLNVYAEVFEPKRAYLVSVAEQFDTSTSTGRMFFQMLGMFSEYEINTIIERMSGGRKKKARGGGYAGGNAAIGYIAQRGTKALEVNHEKTRTVKRVFELRRDNPFWTLQQIADQLNTEGHTTKQGKEFKPMQVKRILDRKDLYSGVYCYAGIQAQGQHQAII